MYGLEALALAWTSARSNLGAVSAVWPKAELDRRATRPIRPRLKSLAGRGPAPQGCKRSGAGPRPASFRWNARVIIPTSIGTDGPLTEFKRLKPVTQPGVQLFPGLSLIISCPASP